MKIQGLNIDVEASRNWSKEKFISAVTGKVKNPEKAWITFDAEVKKLPKAETKSFSKSKD